MSDRRSHNLLHCLDRLSLRMLVILFHVARSKLCKENRSEAFVDRIALARSKLSGILQQPVFIHAPAATAPGPGVILVATRCNVLNWIAFVLLSQNSIIWLDVGRHAGILYQDFFLCRRFFL